MCNDSSIILTQKCPLLYNNQMYFFFISLHGFFLHCISAIYSTDTPSQTWFYKEREIW